MELIVFLKKITQCINLAKTTLVENDVPFVSNSTVARSCLPQPEDIFAHLDRMDNSLLDCINLVEDTLNAKEHDTSEEKFNQDFDGFMSRLNNPEPLNPDYIQINPKFLDPTDDPEFIDYINSLDNPDNLMILTTGHMTSTYLWMGYANHI